MEQTNDHPGQGTGGGGRATSAGTGTATTATHDGASAVEERRAPDDHSTRESFIGSDRSRRGSNVSWGAILAGVVTFLALTLLLNIATAAMGLQGASGTAAGVWSIIALVIALAAAGYVAGALAVRAGLLHGFLTWATSMLAVLVLAGWLGTSLLGLVGNVAGTAAETVSQGTTVTSQDAQDAAGAVDDEDVDEAQQQAEDAVQDAQETVADATDDIAEGAWWAFAGALLGALIAAFAGLAGARSVTNREQVAVVEHREVSRS
jgi:gas vesicle protein